MPKTTYLARVSVLSAEEEGRRVFIVVFEMERNGMKWNEME
jgi:D-alanyl-D-alanine carboxypeptidase